MFKIEVFHALQTRIGPSNMYYLSQNNPLKRNPHQIENEHVTWSPQNNLPATRINKLA